jgi:hypothetical protein
VELHSCNFESFTKASESPVKACLEPDREFVTEILKSAVETALGTTRRRAIGLRKPWDVGNQPHYWGVGKFTNCDDDCGTRVAIARLAVA